MADSAVRLTVKDLGIALVRDSSASQTSIGIVGMKQQARLVNGNLSLQFKAGEETEVSLEVPVSVGFEGGSNNYLLTAANSA